MKYNDNGEYKDIYVKAFDTLPVGAEVDYDGNTVPSGWEEVDGYDDFTSKVTFDKGNPANVSFKKVGKLVVINYQGPSTSYAGGDILFTIPEGYRPSIQVPILLQGQYSGSSAPLMYGIALLQASTGACQILGTQSYGGQRICLNATYVLD